MRLFAIVILLFCSQARAAETVPERVDRVFAKWDKTNSPGCALAVVQEGRIIYERGYGMADLDHDIAISPKSVFHVASVSKQFVAASILLLAQRGKLSLDDPARQYVAELPDFGKPLTIRHLLHHVSGLRDQWSLLILSGWRLSEDVVRDEDVLELVSRMKELNFTPGEMHLYSNTGYTLLAQIVKRVSGKTLREFTQDEIFEPLGMHDTHFRDNHREIVKGMAFGYSQGRSGTFAESIPHYDTVGASSLLTTVEDLAKWQRNFEDPKIGGKEMVDQMVQPFTFNDGTKTTYLLGLQSGMYKGLPVIEHGGADAGYRSSLLRFPSERMSIACLCNLTINPTALGRQVADVFLEAKLRTAVPDSAVPMTLSAQQLSSHVGVYQDAVSDEERRIVVREGKLFSDDVESIPIAETRFRLKDQPMELTFTGRRLTVARLGAKPQELELLQLVTPSATDLAEFAGRYYSEEIDSTYSVRVESGKLVVHRKKVLTHVLEPASQDRFFGIQGFGNLRFERDQAGTVSGFRLSEGRVFHLLFRRVAGS